MYTLKRTGKFIGTPLGNVHCGLTHDQKEYTYSYSITSYSRGLDKDGFVFDNMLPQQWFDSLVHGFHESCELLAKRAAYTFAAWCDKPYHISVCITGFESAEAEYEFYCDGAVLRTWGRIVDYFYCAFTRPVVTTGTGRRK